ncbi:hypothetical protein V1520DRAFT_93929 [Lipomyces starkeyi]|uniref:Uncharacterized protein n=1 Tax=Lipomyces starkeyi NRRL Y-11557 TaxID=675824 RepID=A0A1E3PZ35_LIPST|nr:hypothetical protein LIPSTDRAFT_75046 [Lipomyces starkeyi NRRL Y-11557]
MWDRADSPFAVAFWPWSLLAQPEPLPERLLAADPTMIIDNALNTWGEKPNVVPPDVRLDYIDILRNPVRIHAIWEEYRAAATIDRQRDADDIATGRRIQCPLLALWSGQSGLASWYAQGGVHWRSGRTGATECRDIQWKGATFPPKNIQTNCINIEGFLLLSLINLSEHVRFLYRCTSRLFLYIQ